MKRRSTRPSWRRRPTAQRRNKTIDENGCGIFTVGHSTHPIERFIELLGEHKIAVLADVRSFPSSRKWPHFNQEPFAAALTRAGIEYRWFKNLGGRRHGVRVDSPHTAWEHPAFHSYADYADGAEFDEGLDELTALAAKTRLAYMCSEGLWWRCHRRIISDHLTIRRWRVEHIMPDGKLKPHVLAPFARIVDGKLIYDLIEKSDLNHKDPKVRHKGHEEN